MTPDTLKDLFYVLHNINAWELEEAGVIEPGAKGGSDWTRFNKDIGTFVIKLNEPNLCALAELVSARLPAA